MRDKITSRLYDGPVGCTSGYDYDPEHVMHMNNVACGLAPFLPPYPYLAQPGMTDTLQRQTADQGLNRSALFSTDNDS